MKLNSVDEAADWHKGQNDFAFHVRIGEKILEIPSPLRQKSIFARQFAAASNLSH